MYNFCLDSFRLLKRLDSVLLGTVTATVGWLAPNADLAAALNRGLSRPGRSGRVLPQRKLAHHRRLVGLGGAVSISAASILAATAPAGAQAVITSDTTLTGDINGGGQGGYMVMSGTVTVTDATISDFMTRGGDGSGGGAGMGGAFFVNNGATLVLNNVDMLHNTAKGGTGGAVDAHGNAILTGGALNGGILQQGQANSGADGTTLVDNALLVGDGDGNGLDGTIGRNGANSTTGIGGSGGDGGAGQDGWSTHPILVAKVAFATANYAAKQLAVAAAATSVDPGAADDVVAAEAEALEALTELGAATADLALWELMNSEGRVGIGGDGATGGNGGIGGFGSGGGAGGDGGDGGEGGGGARDGFGGDGGTGGMGGFGAGGGSGGSGGSGEASGGAGDGGLAGFGGGDGSSGVGNSNPSAIGGGGGAGLGGGIFVYSGGTLLIQGNTTFAGNRALAGGSLNRGLSGDQAGTDIFMMSGSNVIFDAGEGHVIQVDGGGGLSISDNTKPKDYAGANDGMFEGAGIEVRSGLTILNGTNTYAGQTYLTGGVLRANEGEGLSSYSNLNFDGGVLETSGDFTRFLGTLNEDVQWTGSGGFSAIGDDLNVRLNNGRQLTWGSGSFVAGGDALLFGSEFTDADVYFLNAINLNGLEGRIIANAGADGDSAAFMDGVISNGSLILGDGTTEGTIVLTAANSYAGSTTVKAGTTLKLGSNGSLANSSNVSIDGGIDISGTTTGASLVTLSGSGDVTLGSKNLTITNGSTAFAGEVAGSGGLTISGGTQMLSGDNSYTGATTINSGATLALAGSGDISDSASVVADGTFSISGTTDGANIKALTGSGAVTLGSKTLSVTAASGTFSGLVSGSGGLDIESGSQTLSGANTYSGKTNIADDANLLLAGAGTVASSSDVVADGTLDISATTSGTSVKTLSGSGEVALGGKTLTVTDGSTTFAGIITGSGGLTVSGGQMLLSGVNTHTGESLVSDGAKLGLTGSGAIAQSSKVTVNGELDIAAATGPVSLVTLAGDGTVTLGATLLALTDADSTFSGGIAGTGGLMIAAGAMTLTGANGYSGKTTVDAGATLAISEAGSMAASAELALSGDLDISDAAGQVDVRTLSGAGDVVLGSKTLDITNASTTFTGSLDGTGAFVVSSGTLGLNGVNSALGVTASGGTINVTGGTIDAGTSIAALGIGNGGTINTSGVTLSGGDSILHATFNESGKVANFTLGAGTIIAEDNETLLVVDRGGAGSDGIVNLVIDSGQSANGDILDSGVKSGNGATSVTVKAGSSWQGLAEVSGFDIETGASVVFDDGSTVDGSLSAAAGSTLFGGTVFAPLTVTGTVEIDNGAITGNIYIEGDLALNGLISPGASPGAVSVGGDVNALSEANSKLEVVFGTATPVAGITHDQINIGGDVTGALPVELARYNVTRGTALGNLADIELMRIGGDITGSITQVNRFTQNGRELFLTETSRVSSDSDIVIHSGLTEQQFFGDTVTVVGLESVVQDETYALATLPSALNSTADIVMGTYADRQGAAERAGESGGWVRGGYSSLDIDSGVDRTNGVAYSQAGVRLGDMGGFTASVLGGFGALTSDVTTELGIAKVAGTVMSGGGELSWTGEHAYVDAAGQYGFGSVTVTPTDASALTIDSQTLSGVIEAGVIIGDDITSVTPWVQLAYAKSSFSNMQSQWVDAVGYTDGQSTVVRAGVRVDADLDGFLPYAGLAVAYDLNDAQSVVVDTFEFGTDGGGSRAELVAGFSTNLGGNMALSGDFKGSYGLEAGDAAVGYQGTAGLKAYW
jgi:fibronectin-binding autotransporter adhesin